MDHNKSLDRRLVAALDRRSSIIVLVPLEEPPQGCRLRRVGPEEGFATDYVIEEVQ